MSQAILVILIWGGGKDDKYFARIGKNVISVYETKTFALIDKKSIKVENVMDFSWSPTDPIFALFVPELGGGNQPARVSLIQIPGKEELRQKNLFSVNDYKMYWQSNRDYLVVKVDRYMKTKKSTYTSFELFRIKERNIPIEVLELENKNDKIIVFAWEPKGHRFAVIHGDNPRPDISFYSMRSGTNAGRVSKLTTLKGKQTNAFFLSPVNIQPHFGPAVHSYTSRTCSYCICSRISSWDFSSSTWESLKNNVRGRLYLFCENLGFFAHA